MTIILSKSAGRPYLFFNGSLDELTIKALDHETSYEVQNSDYAISGYYDRQDRENAERRARGLPEKPVKPWDGKIHLMRQARNGTYFVPIGLLSRAVSVLNAMGVAYDTSISYLPSGETLTLEWKGPGMRIYQKDAVQRAIQHGSGIIQLPTGSGKTLIGCYLVYAYNRPTLVLVHRKELVSQWVEKLETTCGIKPTVFNDEGHEFGPVTVAMVPSLHLWLKENHQLPPFDMLILDEAHHCPADTFYGIGIRCDAKQRFGLSATARREDGADLKMEAALGPIIVSMDANTLIAEGFLARPIFEFVDVPYVMVSGRKYAEIYKNGIVLNDERNRIIAAKAQRLVADGRQVYIHVEQINHGTILSKLVPAPFIHSKSKDREEVVEQFRKGNVRCLISTLLGEGVDIPEISGIIMAGGKKTEVGTIQKVGRALRPSPQFNDAIVIDFADKGKYLSEHATLRYNAYCNVFGNYIVLPQSRS